MRSPQDEQPTNGAAHSKEGEKTSFFKSDYYKNLIAPFFDDTEIQKKIHEFRYNNLVNGFYPKHYEEKHRQDIIEKKVMSSFDKDGTWIIEWTNK